MIESLQVVDFVLDVTVAVGVFYIHWSFSPSRRSCLEDFSVRSSTEVTVAFSAETDSQSAVVYHHKLTATAAITTT